MFANMKARKSELDIFVESAAGIWLAIGELANVGSRYSSHDIQREAATAEANLQKMLDAEVDHWNSDDEHPKLAVCEAQGNNRTWLSGKCEIYTVGGGYCGTCAIAKSTEDEREAKRCAAWA